MADSQTFDPTGLKKKKKKKGKKPSATSDPSASASATPTPTPTPTTTSSPSPSSNKKQTAASEQPKTTSSKSKNEKQTVGSTPSEQPPASSKSNNSNNKNEKKSEPESTSTPTTDTNDDVISETKDTNGDSATTKTAKLRRNVSFADQQQEDEPFIDFGKKKKKAPKDKERTDKIGEETPNGEEVAEQNTNPSTDNTEEEAMVVALHKSDTQAPWLDSDRDYTYSELLLRIFGLLNENNADLVKARKNKYVMKPPEIFRDGTKKTVWVNFAELCKTMHRPTDHVLAYALAELGTSGSLDGSDRLVIKGRFQPKMIESVLRHYVAEYISCFTCKSGDTLLKKENRLYFIQCKACGSSRSVAAIKQGFVAQVGKRRRQ